MTDTERIEELNKTAKRIKNTVDYGMSVSMFINDFLAAVDLINRHQAEIEKLKKDIQESDILIDMQDKALREQTATIEELDADCKKYKAERDEFANHFGKAYGVGRVKALKEVIARAKKEAALCCKGAFWYNPEMPYGGKSEITTEYHIKEDKLEAIVKEMVGESK